MVVISTEYLLLSIILIGMLAMVIYVMNNTNYIITQKNNVDLLSSRLKSVLDNIFYVPDGSDYLIANPHHLTVIFYQGETATGLYYLNITVTGTGYTTTFTEYDIIADNIPINSTYSTVSSLIRITRVSAEFVNTTEIVHINVS